SQNDNMLVCDVYNMKRNIHQRDSFNNFHRMVGGMEDEERAIQQSEMIEQQERELEQTWLALRRKRDYRRERDDRTRGHSEVTEPLTPDEENELRELNNYDIWGEITDPNTGPNDWRLKDPSQQPRHDELAYIKTNNAKASTTT
ncbi:MAG: hypothetical protein ACKPKO_49165, partial [Candidatus Fonsibacter sp.]